MASWNLIICSDIQPTPVVIHCPDPTKWTARDLRSEAGKKLGYPEEDLMLYCNETVLPEGKPLTECQGLKNGVALLATIKPSTVKVFCPHIDTILQIDIPRREWGSWTGATLRTVVCFKLGIDPASSQNDILALKGESLLNSDKVCALNGITGGKDLLLTYTRIQQFQLALPTMMMTSHVFAVPSDITHNFASSHSIYNRHVSSKPVKSDPVQFPTLGGMGLGSPSLYPNWLCFWTITVQQLDGTKTSIKLPDINRTPIYKLRELVKEALSIPTHQQKLTLSGGSNNTIVLEDWDEEGGAMAIAHYPSLHDGATLYLVQLTEGIHVKVHIGNSQSFGVIGPGKPGIVKCQSPPSCRPSTVPSTIPLSSIPSPSYVNIHSPSILSLNSLNKILCKFDKTPMMPVMSSLGGWRPTANKSVYCQSTGKQLSPSDAPVASVKWIADGCTLTFSKPHVIQQPTMFVPSTKISSWN